MARIFPRYWDLFFKITGGFDESAMDDPKNGETDEALYETPSHRATFPADWASIRFAIRRQKAMTIPQIKTLIGQFVAAAGRVQKAGADGVELHAAHGYLLQQFLSPYTNRREDEYGGSLENRMHLLKEIIDGIRKECGKDFPISVRLSVEEYYDMIGYAGQGIVLEEGVKMAKCLESFESTC